MGKPCMLWDFDEFVVIFFGGKLVEKKLQMKHNNMPHMPWVYNFELCVSVDLKLPELQGCKNFEVLKWEHHKPTP